MPTAKSEFPDLFPCDFYTPEELLEPDQLYTVYEIARMLQGLDPDAAVDEGTEEILLDWAIPWVMVNSGDLVVAEPRHDDEPGYYGLKRPGDLDPVASEETDEGDEGEEDGDQPTDGGSTGGGSADDASTGEASADDGCSADDGESADGDAADGR